MKAQNRAGYKKYQAATRQHLFAEKIKSLLNINKL
jgi:hypothetical protein